MVMMVMYNRPCIWRSSEVSTEMTKSRDKPRPDVYYYDIISLAHFLFVSIESVGKPGSSTGVEQVSKVDVTMVSCCSLRAIDAYTFGVMACDSCVPAL